MKLSALHNGKLIAALPIADRGFAYGDGLFETIKVVEGCAQFLSEHLHRLNRDCERLDIHLDRVTLRDEISTLLSVNDCGVLKIVITRKPAQRGYAAPPRSHAERFLLFYPQQFTEDVRVRNGVDARLCRQRLSEQPKLAGIKHLNRLEQVLARAEWSNPTISEGLMLDTGGRLIEGTMSNVFLVSGGSVVTPRLHRCGVAGVMREIIMHQLSVSVREIDLTLADLYAADEIFLSNSLIGIWPVRKVECIHKSVGNVTMTLQRVLENLVSTKPLP